LVNGVAQWDLLMYWCWADETKTSVYAFPSDLGAVECPNVFINAGILPFQYLDVFGNMLSVTSIGDREEFGTYLCNIRADHKWVFERVSDDLFDASSVMLPASVPLHMPRNLPASGIFGGFR